MHAQESTYGAPVRLPLRRSCNRVWAVARGAWRRPSHRGVGLQSNFKLPAYFLYITRAFATLEGIGIGIDEEFSIVKECWPYLAKRLLTDPSPR